MNQSEANTQMDVSTQVAATTLSTCREAQAERARFQELGEGSTRTGECWSMDSGRVSEHSCCRVTAAEK